LEIIILVVAALFLGEVVGWAKDRFERKKFNMDAAVKNEDSPISSIPDMSEGHWIYLDDLVLDLNSQKGGDTNAPQDLLAVLAMGVSKLGKKPKFIGVTCTKNGVDKAETVKIMKATALNVPVYQGNSEYSDGESELGIKIVEESQKGKLTVIMGGPAGDLAWALNHPDCHHWNITLFALMRNTWNAEGSESMPHYKREWMEETARYVAQKLSGRITEIEKPDYYHLIKRKNLPASFQDTGAFIERNRVFKAWDIANSNHVLANNRKYNAGINGNTGSLRIADVLAMAEYCGIRWHDAGAIMLAIQHGLDILQNRIEMGAVDNIDYSVPPPPPEVDRTPIDRSTFNPATAKPYGTGTNVMDFNQSGRITFSTIGERSYISDHTKDGVWKRSKEYQAGRYIDGNDCFVSYKRSKSQWYVWPIEYSLRGERSRPKGASSIPWVLDGDPIGIMSCTNARDGQWNAKGQSRERTNIAWHTA